MIQNPVNKIIKSIKENKKNISGESKNDSSQSVSIIVCSMRKDSIKNVFKNFERQLYKNKEMIIVLNNNEMNIKKWEKKAKSYGNVSVFQLDDKITLGSCLNFAVSKAKYDIIAKFDDDDYYGPKYLSDSINALKYADVIGKAASFVYFKKYKILAIRSPMNERKYVKHMDGPTLIIKRHVFDKITFADIPRGVDTQFSKDCFNKGIKIYSTNRFHHVYIRSESPESHTWKIPNNDLLRMCRKVAQNVVDFTPYVDI